MSSSIGSSLQDRSVVICAGSGGVGKTTTAAAIAAGLAAGGKRVAVVTIDPARRLADALGLEQLTNQPELVDGERFSAAGLKIEGELWAMTLDSQRTFDELIETLSPDAQTRDQILGNRIYQQLSGAVAGSQEFTAIAKLYELERSGRFDAIVLDTPPSRNALDFLDAPDRLTGFFDGRALKLLLAPTGFAARALGVGTGAILGVLKRITGAELLEDLSVFFQALGGLIDGFRERAEAVRALLADPATTFLVITSPQRDSAEEAIFFAGKLRSAQMDFGSLIINRVHFVGNENEPAPALATVAGQLSGEFDEPLAAKLLSSYSEALALAERDAATIERLIEETGEPEPVIVPELAGDVHDVEGLVAIHDRLFAAA
jgi:anion-transporting  ArsA/GET3 family ATPase